MGNHDAGRAMGIAAIAWWSARGNAPDPTKEEALAALDLICKQWSSCDAEFEADDPDNPEHMHPDYSDYTDPINGAPIGRLINIAFDATPEQISKYEDDDVDPWFLGPYADFKLRYNFY